MKLGANWSPAAAHSLAMKSKPPLYRAPPWDAGLDDDEIMPHHTFRDGARERTKPRETPEADVYPGFEGRDAGILGTAHSRRMCCLPLQSTASNSPNSAKTQWLAILLSVKTLAAQIQWSLSSERC
jgi:hypothetical protein